MHKLPYFPAHYYLPLSQGGKDLKFWWSCVLPSIAPDSHAFDFKLHGWDVGEINLLAKLKDKLSCFWDIGAHHGLYSIALSLLSGGRTEIHAFEPSSDCQRRIELHKRMNGISNIRLHSDAVGDHDGSVSFAVPLKAHGTIGHVIVDNAVSSGFRATTVHSVTLDSWLKSSGSATPDLIKIDVEGHEMALLDGAGSLLANGKTAWIFEVLDQVHGDETVPGRKIIERFSRLKDMRIFHIGGDGNLTPAVLQDHYPHTHLCNYLALPTGRGDLAELLGCSL
ncbi:FkbM family methyltransferase [Haloferula sp. BvORR071]|uniref:FkbM family methyltransferase n=1 Tax=Haloferula sp. BvORR071 TaxID=1396141 RepID=UPI002240EC5C|nr:FkbM family methyltransferase [Haloferula sp. BvORR071]